MEKYERSIGLKTIYLTLARRFIYILLIFVPVGLIAFLVINFGITKNYQSTSVVQKNAVFSAAHHQGFTSIVKSEQTAKSVAESLVTANFRHSNSKEITYDEIISGLSVSAFNSSSQSINVSIYYKSTDSAITQRVLEEVTTLSVKSALEKSAKDYDGLVVSSVASGAQDISNTKKYILIALAADVVLALAVPFIYEIVADEVYDKEDVESLGCEGFTIKIPN